MPRTLALVGLLLCLSPAGASPADIKHHYTMTVEVLEDLGWEDSRAVTEAAHCAMAADICRLPALTRAVTTFALPSTGAHFDRVAALAQTAPFSERASVGFHFNSLYTFDDIRTRWHALGLWVDTVCRDILSMPPGEERFETTVALVGLVAHVVQDFYVHANWVDLVDAFTLGPLETAAYPLWEELIENRDGWRDRSRSVDVTALVYRMRVSNTIMETNPTLGGLQTGRIAGEIVPGPVAPWPHRHALGRDQDVAHALGKRATELWVGRILENLSTADGGTPPRSAIASPLPGR